MIYGDLSISDRHRIEDRTAFFVNWCGVVAQEELNAWESGISSRVLHKVLAHPRKTKRLFAGYERAVNRAMDIYLRFVDAWYTKEFIEVFLAPRSVLGLAPAINAATPFFMSHPRRTNLFP